MEESLRAFGDAVEAFAERLVAVEPVPLAVALAFVLLNLLLRTTAWRNIVAAAYPDAVVRWRDAFGAYAAGVGVNSVLPARAGDVMKLFLLHRSVPGATYPTLAATLVAETVLDAVVAGALILVAWRAGLLPVVPDPPSLPAFEFAWVADHLWVIPVSAGAILVLVLVIGSHVRSFWARVRQGLVILTTPGRFAREVAVYQLLGWGCRLVSAWYFLEAFNVPPSLEAIVLVQVASSAATVMPATPGGLGPKQALLVLVLAGEAARADVLAFSVGMEVATTILYVVLGAACMFLMLGSVRLRGAVAQAREAREAEPGPSAAAPDAPAAGPPAPPGTQAGGAGAGGA